MATANAVLGGPYDVTASATGLTAVNFTLTNTCPTITAQVSGSPTICAGGSAQVSVQLSGGTAPYTVKLSNGETQTGTSQQALFSFTVSPTSTTSYSVSSATDANGCAVTASGSALVTVNPLPVADAVAPAAICSDATTNIALSGTMGASFSWAIGTVTGTVSGQLAGKGTSIAQTLTGSGTVTYVVTPTLNGCAGTPVNIVQAVTAAPTITDPSDLVVGTGATASFSVTASTPAVQWSVSTDGGTTFTPLNGQTNPTLTLSNVTPAMNGNPYRAVADNGCQPATSAAARLTVNELKVGIGDPLVCLNANGLVGVTATVTNNNAGPVVADFTAMLPTTLTGLPGTGLASINAGGVTVSAAAVTWMGTIPANTTVTITYKVQVAAGTPPGQPLCVDSVVTFNGGPGAMVQACATLNCPAGPVNAAVSDQKAGALLVFPYYTSKAATQSDTRLTLSNVGDKVVSVHLFFIDGTSCQQADFFLCLTPNGSFSFKASEYDGETMGWLLAVAVDAQGRPVQYNGLIGNAFVRDGAYVGNYGAESFGLTSHADGDDGDVVFGWDELRCSAQSVCSRGAKSAGCNGAAISDGGLARRFDAGPGAGRGAGRGGARHQWE
jgi:hypothetical protein